MKTESGTINKPQEMAVRHLLSYREKDSDKEIENTSAANNGAFLMMMGIAPFSLCSDMGRLLGLENTMFRSFPPGFSGASEQTC